MNTLPLADPDVDLDQLCQAYRRAMFLPPAPAVWNCRQQCAVEATCPLERENER